MFFVFDFIIVFMFFIFWFFFDVGCFLNIGDVGVEDFGMKKII